jgi:Ca2+-binding EF-hand superfamily protein
MKKVFTRTLLLSFCLLLAGAAMAADTPCTMQGDADKDGCMSCTEAKSFASERFTAMDTDKSKTLNMDEMESGMTAFFKEMDTDKNGMVNVEEYVTYWCGTAPKTKKAAAKGNKQPQFKKIDRNNDGKIDVGECTAVWTVRFSDADASKDGKLTKQEYVQSLILWFADTDSNLDSSITVTEWTNYWIGKCQAEKMIKALSKK